MDIFNCIVCEFSSNRKLNYNIHLKTKKHLAKINASQMHPK
jgi:hypothetical protein